MRIIGGKYRGRKIKQPKSKTVRPTKDRVREAVFNVIAEKVPDSRVLDLFAGSGAYALEALSRGAKEAVFVEKEQITAGIIKENVRILEIEEPTKIIVRNVDKAMDLLNRENRQFDLIFCDPPYNIDMIKKTLIMVNHYDILSHLGLMVIEHHRDENIPRYEGNVFICKQRTYGKTLISIFQKNDKKSNLSRDI